VSITPGEPADRATLERLAETIADLTLRVANGADLDAHLCLTEPIATKGPFPALVFSGGVGEYLNGAQTREFGDLGALLGAAIARRRGAHTVLRAVESIRATCIGASQYTIQVSGDTLFLTDRALLPLRDLAAVAIHPSAPDAAAIASEVRGGIVRLDRQNSAFVIAVRWTHGPAYAALRALCTGIADGATALLPEGGPLVVVLDADVAGIVGQILQDECRVRSPLICVDQIALSDLDFIDIGAVIPEREVVPVVVKSLVFAER
ncbi:MAG TPA: ethanolamine ammonia-lyase reactivating factor EutA, partial [Candidatus Limnocylindrales bacterium]|nr:ethanolamine ammonia-lyase reactivating factor EutA [Candidatus Limnocylindrales bacterium]